MTSSDPQRPGQGDDDPTVIHQQADPNGAVPQNPPGDADATQIATPYAAGPQAPATTYGQPDPYANPYAQQPADPYAAPANPYANPYGQTPDAASDPYAAQNPYAQQPADPYAAQNPYGAPSDPYAQNPYAAPGDPYAAQNPQGGLPQYPGYPTNQGQGAPGYPYPGYGQAPQAGTNGLAIASLVCGILSIPLACAWAIGTLAGIAGLIMGIAAMNQIKKTGQDGNGMALAGIITSVLGIALGLVFIVLLIIGLSIDTSSTDYLLGLLR